VDKKLIETIVYYNNHTIVMKSDMQELIDEYLNTFTEKERQAYIIAKDHLGMSFDMEKSNGFIEWLQKRSST
jgi:hypothetical protein|tara:strand:- start:612 stop:827 length:216 start_codon:yes stop_codon:yes gene_type:complete